MSTVQQHAFPRTTLVRVVGFSLVVLVAAAVVFALARSHHSVSPSRPVSSLRTNAGPLTPLQTAVEALGQSKQSPAPAGSGTLVHFYGEN